MSGGTVNGSVYGGYTYGDATGNTVIMSGGLVNINAGGVYGGYSNDGNVINNTVTVSEGAIHQKVYGGYSFGGNATGNAVTVSGGTIAPDVSNQTHNNYIATVYGSYSEHGKATRNTKLRQT